MVRQRSAAAGGRRGGGPSPRLSPSGCTSTSASGTTQAGEWMAGVWPLRHAEPQRRIEAEWPVASSGCSATCSVRDPTHLDSPPARGICPSRRASVGPPRLAAELDVPPAGAPTIRFRGRLLRARTARERATQQLVEPGGPLVAPGLNRFPAGLDRDRLPSGGPARLPELNPTIGEAACWSWKRFCDPTVRRALEQASHRAAHPSLTRWGQGRPPRKAELANE